MNRIEDFQERVSAMADGQLDGEAFARTVAEVGVRDELRGAWHTYHLVGEVLRTGRHAASSDPDAFLARFRQRLAAEPAARAVPPEPVQAGPRAEAANEPVFRWKLVAGVASMAAVAAIGWHWVGVPGGGVGGTQLVQVPQPAAAVVAVSDPAPARGAQPVPAAAAKTARVLVMGSNGAPAVMLRNPRLDALLEAHRQAAGPSQMPAGFVRDATFEAPAR